MIAALAITVHLLCGVPITAVVELDGEIRIMTVQPGPANIGPGYEVTSGNSDIRFESQAWQLLRNQGRGTIYVEDGCEDLSLSTKRRKSYGPGDAASD